MAYLDSAKVKVYPTALRGDSASDPTASLNTEFNITSLITRLCDKECFVVDKRTEGADEVFIVSLKGYWFELHFAAADLQSNLFVGIKIIDKEFDFYTPMLSNLAQGTVTILDASNKFQGLDYSTTAFDSSYISLQLWDGTNQEVPEASWIRIDSTKVGNKSNLAGDSTNNIRSQLTTNVLDVKGAAILSGKYQTIPGDGDVIIGGSGDNSVSFSGVTGGVVHPVMVYVTGSSSAEATWRSAEGKMKLIAGTIDGNGDITFSGAAQEYQLVNFSYSNNKLSIKYEQ